MVSLQDVEEGEVNIILQAFKKLSNKDKDVLVVSIVDEFTPRQLYLFSEKLQGRIVKRDFLQWLPRSVSSIILKYCGKSTSLECMQVSRQWYEVICQDSNFWKRQCVQRGIKLNLKTIKTCYFRIDTLFGIECTPSYHLYKDGVNRLSSLSRFCLDFSRPMKGKVFEDGLPRVSALACLGNNLACGSMEGVISVYDLKEEKLVTEIASHACSCLQLLPEDCLIAGSYHRNVELWNWRSGIQLMALRGHTAAVLCVDAIDKNGFVVSGSSDCIRVWSLANGSSLHASPKVTEWILAVRFLWQDSASRPLVVSVEDSSVQVWSNDLQCIATLTVPDIDCQSFHFTPSLAIKDGCIVCGSSQGVLVWNSKDFKLIRQFSSVEGFAVLSWGRYFMATYNLKLSSIEFFQVNDLSEEAKPIASLNLFDSQFTKRLNYICFNHSGWLDGINVNESNSFLAAVTLPTGKLCVYKWNDSEQITFL